MDGEVRTRRFYTDIVILTAPGGDPVTQWVRELKQSSVMIDDSHCNMRYDYSLGGGGAFGNDDDEDDNGDDPSSSSGGNSYEDDLGEDWGEPSTHTVMSLTQESLQG